MVKSVVLSWEKGRSPVVRVVVVKLLVRWVLVRGKVLVAMGLQVVVLKKVVGPVDVACLLVLAIGLDIARWRSPLGEQQKPSWDGVGGSL